MGQSGRVGPVLVGDRELGVGSVGTAVDSAYCAAVTASRAPQGWAPRRLAHVVEERPGLTVVIAEVDGAAELERALPGLGTVPVGIGAVREGPAGAQQSVRDAVDVLALGRPGVARFEDEWVLATLMAHRERLAVVCEEVSSVAQRSGHLAEAVLAFADEGLSVVSAARAVHIHPNTMIYRLERWKALTGWDARTFAGLARSVACIRMGR